MDGIDRYFDIPEVIQVYDKEADTCRYELTVSVSVEVKEYSKFNQMDGYKIFNSLKEKMIRKVRGFTAFTTNHRSK